MSGRKRKPNPSSAAREAVAAEVAEMQRVAAAAFKRPDKKERGARARTLEEESGSKYYAFALATTTDASADRRAEMLNRLVGAVEVDARAAGKVSS